MNTEKVRAYKIAPLSKDFPTPMLTAEARRTQSGRATTTSDRGSRRFWTIAAQRFRYPSSLRPSRLCGPLGGRETVSRVAQVFQPAVSPISNRQGRVCEALPTYDSNALQDGILRYSRLETC